MQLLRTLPAALNCCFCAACLKDLQRFLRKDDTDTRDVFFRLANWNTACNDLLPIQTKRPWSTMLVRATSHRVPLQLLARIISLTHALPAVRVLTFLTMPINPTSAQVAAQRQHLLQIKVLPSS
jgi:timeless